MNRAVDIVEGRLFVVTDLHGEWAAYVRYRDAFLGLYSHGQADRFILLGDVVHHHGEPDEDYSLHILWDIMRLQSELGTERVILLLGNHELPHIYTVPISRGDEPFTSRFEHTLGEYRESIVAFLKSLPFMIRTAGGVMFVHAGADKLSSVPEHVELLHRFSHDGLLAEAERLLASSDVQDLIARVLQLSAEEYDRAARLHAAVTGPDDPRYFDYLRGIIVGHLEPEWDVLWGFFFNRGEKEMGEPAYRIVLHDFLRAHSVPGQEQRVLVSGHIAVHGGHAIVAQQQLRLASWSHAGPKTAGEYLLVEASTPVRAAQDLVQFLHPMP